ncbi:hypothetical protein BS50DRAFT_34271 [Corynespora cassiicola Philippines]|uniref:Uncharacterized protein n=1 Tax=Corynespora cassiicola Philippines TaxID=1448308 RepID=A0A2T2PC32_CORCC|nr:hypothetical protein BS50DRAFT_34271 [Corynespora cassiicola Philippines]
MDGFSDETWGITIRECYNHCGLDKIPYEFDFQVFATSFTNFLLPWIALTAQLPYETSTPWDNLLSLCLSVGSPALITYSLTLTIMNRYSLRTPWRDLYQKAQSRAVHDRYSDLSVRIQSIQYLLQEAQQVPLRASQERGWLSSLMVSPKNRDWWKNLQKRLKRTRRGVTFSLIAQILAAAIAWLFSIATAFQDSRGDRIVAHQLSSSSLWLWLVPVIWGWVAVGTQNAPDSIDEALKADGAHRAKETPIAQGEPLTVKGDQKGIVVRSGLALQPHRTQTNQGAFEVPPLRHLKLPKWLGGDIIGDEKREGPIFNYARVFTWWQLAHQVESALSTAVDAVYRGEACLPLQSPAQSQKWVQSRREENIAGDAYTTAQYCGLNHGKILAYPAWKTIPADVWKRIFSASVAAMTVQWGTTGSALLIAYYTPTKGIGCRSAGYLIYGGLATLVWLLLASSMMFSHAALLLYQQEHAEHPSTNFQEPHEPPTKKKRPLQRGYDRTFNHSLLCGLAVTSRLFGKTIAILNALWLIVSSLLEFTSVYDRCYCRGNQTGLGMEHGWIVLFKSEKDLADYATSSWVGGLTLSIIVCFGSYIFFWLASRRSAEEE